MEETTKSNKYLYAFIFSLVASLILNIVLFNENQKISNEMTYLSVKNDTLLIRNKKINDKLSEKKQVYEKIINHYETIHDTITILMPHEIKQINESKLRQYINNREQNSISRFDGLRGK